MSAALKNAEADVLAARHGAADAARALASALYAGDGERELTARATLTRKLDVLHERRVRYWSMREKADARAAEEAERAETERSAP